MCDEGKVNLRWLDDPLRESVGNIDKVLYSEMRKGLELTDDQDQWFKREVD